MKIGLIILLTLTISFSDFGKAQLMGIDLGSELWKACTLKHGKNIFSIVENSKTKRKTPTTLGFFN